MNRVCVVGAGPAGIIATAALVQQKCSVVWVDTVEGFNGTGRLGSFKNVHANTKVELVAAWFESGVLGNAMRGCPESEAAVAAIRAGAAPSTYPPHGDPNKGLVMLGAVVDALACISKRLQSRDDVTIVHGRAAALALSTAPGGGNRSSNGTWEVQLGGGLSATADADAVLLATGAVEAPLPSWCAELQAGVVSSADGATRTLDGGATRTGPRIVPGELAVDAAQLKAAVVPGEKIALLGTSHSAALVAMHLENMQWSADDYRVFSPTPAKQADWVAPGQYHWSATGLKGIASAFFAEQVRRKKAGTSRTDPRNNSDQEDYCNHAAGNRTVGNAADGDNREEKKKGNEKEKETEMPRERDSAATAVFPFLDHQDPSLLEEDVQLRNSFDVVIPTIGYRNAPLPSVTVDGRVVQVHKSARDPETSQLLLQDAATTCPADIFRPGQAVTWNRACEHPALRAGMIPTLMGLGIGWPDYFETPASHGERVGIGFGGPPDPHYGMAGENYVGFNAMIARAERIAASLSPVETP